VIAEYPQIGFAVVEAPANELQLSRKRLRAAGHEVWLDTAAQLAYTPNDPRWNDQWHVRTIRADLAWDRHMGSNSAVVAIMDTGVETTHEDLAANIWQNPNEVPGNGVDDDGNGYVDDVVGWDFDANDPVPNDVHGHGTACAGIAAAVGDNSIGISGVAPRARIMGLKASNDSGYFYVSANVPAYLYAADNGADVISMSFFSDSLSPAERAAIDYCWENGTLPVAAAGNDSTVFPYYPGAYENVVAVAAINSDLGKSSFSDWGSWVDVSAPGNGLIATAKNNGYGGFGGTSGACPHVAGVAALLFGAKPDATVQEVRNAIEDSARLQNQAPFGEFSNYGLVDADAALDFLLDGYIGRHRPKVRWISPLVRGGEGTITVYGRTLDVASVWAGGPLARVAPVARARDWMELPRAGLQERLSIQSTSGMLASVALPEVARYPLIEAAQDNGALVYGGFVDTVAADKLEMRGTRRSSGNIILECAFKRLPGTGPTKLVLKRRYAGGGTANERIQIYNWSAGSYPYGTWTTLRNEPEDDDSGTFTLDVPNPSNHVDYEGSVYVRIVRDSVPSGGELFVDQMYLEAG